MTEERRVHDEAGQPGADVLTKMTPISEARNLAGDVPCVAPHDMDLREVARRMWRRRGVRTAAVVDAEGRLVGVIPLRLLLDELFFHVVPEEFISEILERERIEEVGRMVLAERAGELMEPPVYVTLDDTVRDAFSRMHDHKLEGLPIVDEGMRPVGYLDRFQLLEVWLRAHRPRVSGSP
jgi:CBS-domain-containing membrane protein